MYFLSVLCREVSVGRTGQVSLDIIRVVGCVEKSSSSRERGWAGQPKGTWLCWQQRVWAIWPIKS